MRRIDLKRANVARTDTIRDINRQIVLNYVREREIISRAAIARETELHRSTISLIVDKLVRDGLIEEYGEGEPKGGRPPTLLRLRAAGPVAIGVDLGTMRTIVATSDLAGRVLEQVEFDTHKEAERTLDNIIKCARKLIAKSKGTIEGIGVSVPGLVDPVTGDVLYVPHFRWQAWPLSKQLSAATGLNVTTDNDANAAALAELWFGRPEVRETRDFTMVLIDEGVGTGVVFDGQVYRGKGGGAGEFGHMTIGRDAPVACALGSRECWEAFASERAALARYEKLAGVGSVNGSVNGSANGHIKFGQLIDLAFDEDGAALSALKETARYLGVGISNLIKGLSPEAVIVSGLIVRAWPLIAQDVQRSLDESLCRGLPTTRVIASTLGPHPTLLGALSLVLGSKFASIQAT